MKMMTQMKNSFISQRQQRIQDHLQLILDNIPRHSQPLSEGMAYGVLNGGKRLRALLVYGVGESLGLDPAKLDDVAASIEMIHAYSLIHDDLPAMDDAFLRRGQASCHRRFGEANAILIGDALQALAFDIITTAEQLNDQEKIKTLRVISQAAREMVAGQALDINATAQQSSMSYLQQMHHLKTGAVIQATFQIAGLLAKVDPPQLKSLAHCGEHLGLLYQIQDDLLDASSTKQLGKPQAQDETLNKLTFLNALGKEKTQQRLQYHQHQLQHHLQQVCLQYDHLTPLLDYLFRRDY
jgi:farnesyl diphosphate synthase